MSGQSAVEFSGERRIHVGLAVTDIEQSRRFYATLLGVPPAKVREGYVKFEPESPSLNLTLNEVAGLGAGRPGHYGIQVKSSDAVREARRRFEAAGLVTNVEEGEACCYAVQDKVWVTDPDGNEWEVFVVLEADVPQRKSSTSECCAPEAAGTASACC